MIYVFVSNFWTYKQIVKETDITSSDDDSEHEPDDENLPASSSVLGNATISKYFTFFR